MTNLTWSDTLSPGYSRTFMLCWIIGCWLWCVCSKRTSFRFYPSSSNGTETNNNKKGWAQGMTLSSSTNYMDFNETVRQLADYFPLTDLPGAFDAFFIYSLRLALFHKHTHTQPIYYPEFALNLYVNASKRFDQNTFWFISSQLLKTITSNFYALKVKYHC